MKRRDDLADRVHEAIEEEGKLRVRTDAARRLAAYLNNVADRMEVLVKRKQFKRARQLVVEARGKYKLWLQIDKKARS